MTAKNQAEIINQLLMQLDPIDRADVLRFVLMRLAQRKADAKPFITVEEWERLKVWQRKAIYWRVRWYVFLNGLRALIHA